MIPSQIRRLAEFAEESDCTIEVVQTGAVIQFNNGTSKFSVDGYGNNVSNPNQDTLC